MACLCFHSLITSTLCCLIIVLAAADKLDDILLSSSGIFQDDSLECPPGSTSTIFSSVFSSTQHISNWGNVNLLYEEDAFEMDMIHHHSDDSEEGKDRDWMLRIGKGGQIMSLIVKPGESIANQVNEEAIWNDLVQQMVAVDSDLNSPEYPNYIHGSGVYANTTEGTKPPFYNPKLAFKCEGNDCTMINWGQQAHVPTPWDSPLLFYTRYRDCGDGVIQFDMAMYHFGREASRFNYLNTPWTGVRTSTFPDVLTSNRQGNLEVVYPLHGFGTDQVRNLDTTGGFTSFAEELDVPEYEFPFCVDSTDAKSWYYCDSDTDAPSGSSQRFSFDVKVANATRHSDHWRYLGLAERSTVRMQWCDLNAPITAGSWGWGSPGRNVTITNENTGFSFQSDYIIHYCWEGGTTYMSASVNASVIDREFPPGATIHVAYTNRNGRPWDQQNALAFVHGQGDEYPQDWHNARSRMRYGVTDSNRDGTVFTTNAIVKLNNGEFYFSRKFLVTDLLSNIESTGKRLNGEAFEVVGKAGELGNGENVRLWMDSTSFGASVGSETCYDAKVVCEGSSAPSGSTRPLFYITCGSNTITSYDPYTDPYTGKAPTDFIKRPYICQLNETDTAKTGRANWKLLGFFTDGDCSGIARLKYSSDFCELRSTSPSLTPSLKPPPSVPKKCSLCYQGTAFDPVTFNANLRYCTMLLRKTQEVDDVGKNCIYPQLDAVQSCGCPPVVVQDWTLYDFCPTCRKRHRPHLDPDRSQSTEPRLHPF